MFGSENIAAQERSEGTRGLMYGISGWVLTFLTLILVATRVGGAPLIALGIAVIMFAAGTFNGISAVRAKSGGTKALAIVSLLVSGVGLLLSLPIETLALLGVIIRALR